ncbi:olfactory receptor 6M1-like [Lissotriton helveticus]
MDMKNKSLVTEFIFVGFTGGPELQIPIFVLVLFIYAVTVLGNVLMITLICIDRRLHTPMYFFLWNLSLLETVNISNTVPLMLFQMFSVHKSIAKANCLMQSFVYVYLATIIFLILTIMSFDRYVAICIPLRYTTIMSGRFCIQLIIGAWVSSLICVLYPTIAMNGLPFCGPNIIDHFYCDGLSVVKLACMNTRIFHTKTIILALAFLLSSLGLTVMSYTFIISKIVRIPSTKGRQKAFSTCSSHLTMVILIYGAAIFVEVSPAMHPSDEVYKTVNIFGNIISPLMNPFVYTFRNENVRHVLKTRIQREICCR